MLAAVTDHVWQSTLIAVLAAGFALALRKHAASARYWLWFAASAKFLIPFSLLVALGGQLSWRVSQTTEPAEWRLAASRVLEPPAQRSVSGASDSLAPDSAVEVPALPPETSDAAARASRPRFGLQAALLAAWACGVVVVLGAAWRRWMRLLSLLRASRPVSLAGIGTHGLEVRLTRAPIEPGVFGIFRPVLVLPESILERLSHAELEAIVLHERMHVARRDNLTALPHMLVQALFWFHPLVWWLGAKLVAERERACDEAVLASGAEPRAYAGGIVAVCEAYVASPLRCAAGVGGGPLERRVADILARRKSRALGAAGRYALLAVAAAVLAAPLLAGALAPRAASAQRAPATLDARFEDDDARYLWAPLPGPPPLVNGYGGGSNGRHFNMSLQDCAIRDADDADPDVGVPPDIFDFKSLVRYAYDLDYDELVWRNPTEVPGLRVSEYPRVRHSECRAFLRSVLESGYALETHEEDGRLVVDRIDVPPVPLSPLERGPLPPVELESALLDSYTGYYYGYPEAFAREFAPVFRLRRDGTNLVLEWSGRSFVLHAQSATQFSTLLRYELGIGKPSVALSLETDDTGRRHAVVKSSRHVPKMVARPIDAPRAEALLRSIEEKIESRASNPFARAFVDATVARLDAAEPVSDVLADATARALAERIERWRPGALAGRGRLSSVLFREVLPSGREIYEASYESLAIHFDVVTALDGTVRGAFVDVACRMRRGPTSPMAPCVAPFYVGDDPRVAVIAEYAPFASLNLFTGAYVGTSSELRALLSLEACDSPESSEAAGPASSRVISSRGDRLSDFVRNVYHLERDELVWEADTDPDVFVRVPRNARDGSPRNADVPLTYDCEAFARRALSEELGLEGHFETRRLPAYDVGLDLVPVEIERDVLVVERLAAPTSGAPLGFGAR